MSPRRVLARCGCPAHAARIAARFVADREPSARTRLFALALLGVGIPLFMLGLFPWNMPSRYTSASLLPMLLCAFAFAQHCVD